MKIGNPNKVRGIAIDTGFSISGNIYNSGVVQENHLHYVSNTYEGVGDNGPEGVFYALDQAFVLPTSITYPDTIDDQTFLCPLFTNGSPPTISSPVVDTETTVTGLGVAWTNYPTVYDYQWYYSVMLPGPYSLVSTDSTYTPTEVGYLKVRVRARNGYGYNTSSSAPYSLDGYIESGASQIQEA